MTAGRMTVLAEPPDEMGSLKTQFLASLNHEIRTPLTGILGMTDLLLETPLDEEQKDYLATVRLCAEDLLALLNKTLEFSHLAAGQMTLTVEEFHLLEALKGAVSAYSPKAWMKGLRLVCRLAPDLPEVAIGDAVRLRQMLSYVIENAVKFTERGRVEVSASGLLEGGKFHLVVKVSDTGIGIPRDKLVTVFESFRQLDSGLARTYSGLGLGLSLVQKLVALMGGNLSVDSEPGQGSVFTVTIPLELPAEQPAAPESFPAELANAGAGKGRRRILFVEDNDVAQRVVTHILKRGGHEAQCASSGPEAIQAVSNGRYDLILMDLQMPGMDGFETAVRIRGIPGYASVPIVALTANATQDYRSLCLGSGMQGFIPKPVQAEDVLSTLSSLLR
jgi:CheY-like chemotaxis protein